MEKSDRYNFEIELRRYNLEPLDKLAVRMCFDIKEIAEKYNTQQFQIYKEIMNEIKNE